jgi:hypothetical protein
MNPTRDIGYTTIKGAFSLPIGVNFLQRESGALPKFVTISTVCLENGHLEDPLGICEPEHGYETMVFLEDCTFFALHTAKYKTRKAAKAGHETIVQKILSGELPLAIQIGHYHTWD